MISRIPTHRQIWYKNTDHISIWSYTDMHVNYYSMLLIASLTKWYHLFASGRVLTLITKDVNLDSLTLTIAWTMPKTRLLNYCHSTYIYRKVVYIFVPILNEYIALVLTLNLYHHAARQIKDNFDKIRKIWITISVSYL